MCKVCKDLESIVHEELWQYDLSEDAQDIKLMSQIYFDNRNLEKYGIEPDREKTKGQFGMLMMIIGVKEMMEFHGLH